MYELRAGAMLEAADHALAEVTARELRAVLNDVKRAQAEYFEQMRKLPAFLRARRENYEALAAGLRDVPGVRVLPQPVDGRLESCHYCLSALLDEGLVERRPEIMAALGERGIGTSVYYPQPVPRMTYYREKYHEDLSRFPVAADIADASLALPVGPHVNEDDLRYICRQLQDTVAEIQA